MTINVEQIWHYYYYIGLIATILFGIKLLVFSVTGGDSEVFGDFNTETDTDISFNFFSIQSILAFFMGFGWMGYAGLKQMQLSQGENLVVSVIIGLVFMLVSSGLMFFAKKLEKNIKKDKKTALNHIGKAYTKFEPNGKGQIEIVVNEQLTISEAVNDSDKEIKSFELIKVVKIENEVFHIIKAQQ